MSISISVRYSRQEQTEHKQSYDLKVEVINATDVSTKIFVFQRRVLSAMDAEANRELNQFICLADPVDLEEVPEDAPDLQNNMPYFRSSVVILRFRSMTELEETQQMLDEDIAHLVASLKAAANLVVMENKVYA